MYEIQLYCYRQFYKYEKLLYILSELKKLKVIKFFIFQNIRSQISKINLICVLLIKLINFIFKNMVRAEFDHETSWLQSKCLVAGPHSQVCN
jgi:hypothetical protein